MDEDFGLDVMMEDMINGGYGYILNELDNEAGWQDMEEEGWEDEDWEEDEDEEEDW